MGAFQTKPILFNRARRSADISSRFLRWVNPVSELEIAFLIQGRYATVSITLAELQQDGKMFTLTVIATVPDKSYCVQPASAFHR